MAWFNPSSAEVGDTLYLASPFGWSSYTVSEWTVTRKTKSGQIVCRRGEREMRLTASGRIIGSGSWSREHFVSAEGAADLRAERAAHDQFRAIEALAEAVVKAAHNRDDAALHTAFGELAQAMSAFGRDPKGLEAKPASAVGEADAPGPVRETPES